MQTASNWARTQLARTHKTEFSIYYSQLKERGVARNRAVARAKNMLVDKYKAEYTTLVKIGLANGKGKK